MRGKLEWGWGVVALACSGPPVAAAPPPRELTFLHTSDVHSRLWPFRDRISSVDADLGLGTEGELEEVGGAARLATRLAEERRDGAALWLDSGDLLEGAPVFGRYGGAVEVQLWGALGVDAMALGNHELSLSAEALQRLFTAARFPVLAANLLPSDSSRWLLPSVIVFAGRTAVGVVGCGNGGSPPSITAANNPWGLSVVDAAAAVQSSIDELAARTDLVVALSHLGLEGDRDLIRATSGIDLVLGGHQHTLTLEPEWEEDCATRELQRARGCSPRRVPIVHSGAYGRYVSRIELRLSAGEVRGVTLTHVPLSARVAPDPATSAHLEAYQSPPELPLGYLPERLARNTAHGGDSALGNLVTDAIQEWTGADVVLLNSSGLRDDLEAGPLLAGDLELAFPFEEPWRLVWLSGRELRAGLQLTARKSASRGCETSVQVAGLWLRVHCDACGEELTECWRAGRGDKELADTERLLVALPRYLTMPGADFEALGELGTDLALSVSQTLRRHLARAPRLLDPRACALDLERASPARCAEAFGIACPITAAVAEHVCRGLPSIQGARDGRVEMRP